jgi:hypothetical protein
MLQGMSGPDAQVGAVRGVGVGYEGGCAGVQRVVVVHLSASCESCVWRGGVAC